MIFSLFLVYGSLALTFNSKFRIPKLEHNELPILFMMNKIKINYKTTTKKKKQNPKNKYEKKKKKTNLEYSSSFFSHSFFIQIPPKQ